MHNKLIIANWKSNKTLKEALSWLQVFLQQERSEHAQYVICPPFPLLYPLHEFLLTHNNADHVSLGVQDLSPYEAGPYTGAVSPQSLEGLGVTHVLLGHSERRKYFGETNELVAKKAAIALEHELTPVVCVDRNQVRQQANTLTEQQRQRVVVAYEPVHAISTFGGHEDPISTTLTVVDTIHAVFGDSTPVLYGGSVDPENGITYLTETSIAGVLVGKTSLDPIAFARV